mmetsp:Transcript_7419/g.21935  ORF Transcript_7419/g.21935 Transcript_7419/m.21935 type:complete len:754 (-) Transcript_7419:297-2558(-)
MASDSGLIGCLKLCDLHGEEFAAHHCVSACLETVGLRWEVDHPGGLGVLASVLIVSLVLVPLCALFSGLTLGLLSLDMNGLKILEEGGDADEREHARLIIPIREKGNLLLCTLLLGNTIVNAATSIIVADVTSGVAGLIISTGLIVLFGEIVPQSICTRHGLRIGASLIPLVKVFTFLLWPIAYPISLGLDRILGRDIGTVYSQEELLRLIDLHCTDPAAQRESGLTRADHRLLMGALSFKHKLVRDVMTPLRDCFMLASNLRLNFQTMLAIYKSGYTRIPVFEGTSHNIIGILYAKDLILVDPDDEIEVGAMLSLRSRDVGHVRWVPDDSALEVVFNQIMASNNHMLIATRGASRPTTTTATAAAAAVASPSSLSRTSIGSAPGGDVECNGEQLQECTVHYDADPNEVVGLITLEDIIEEVLQAEIRDETDTWQQEDGGSRRGPRRVELERYLSMFEHKIAAGKALSPQEIQAIAAFLSASVQEFAGLASSNVALKGLIRHSEVMEREAPSGEGGGGALQRALSHSVSLGEVAGSAFQELALADPQLVLYRRGERSGTFTLILQGRVLIHTGAEEFELELSAWSVLGQRALSSQSYEPDFDAVALPPCRLLRIPRSAYQAALESTRPAGLPLAGKSAAAGPSVEALSVNSASGVVKAQHPSARRMLPASWRTSTTGASSAGALDEVRRAEQPVNASNPVSSTIKEIALAPRSISSASVLVADLEAASVGTTSSDKEQEQNPLLLNRAASDAV